MVTSTVDYSVALPNGRGAGFDRGGIRCSACFAFPQLESSRMGWLVAVAALHKPNVAWFFSELALPSGICDVAGSPAASLGDRSHPG